MNLKLSHCTLEAEVDFAIACRLLLKVQLQLLPPLLTLLLPQWLLLSVLLWL